MTPIDYNNPNDLWRNNGYDPYKGLSDKERIKAGCLQLVCVVGTIIAGLALCALLGSCTTTKYVPVTETHTDTLRVTQYLRDSIYIHDSTHVREKGDTVLIERWHTRWRDRWQHDTLYISKTDSVPKPYPVEVEVPAPLTWWQQVRMGLGTVALMAGALWLAVRAFRRR